MYSKDDQSLISFAVALASDAHKDQMWGMFPYAVHLDRTARTLGHHGFNGATFQAAAWLHDSIEDTDADQDQIGRVVSKEVADIVWAITDGEGINRAARKAIMWPKLEALPIAASVKIADRIVNVSNAVIFNPDILKMYEQEQPEFQERMTAILDRIPEPQRLRTWGLLATLEGIIG